MNKIPSITIDKKWSTDLEIGGDILDTTPGWSDLIGDVGGSVKQASPPTWVNYREGIWAYQFKIGQQIWMNFHVPHSWSPGTNMYPHIHWTCNTLTAQGKRAKFGVEYTVAKRSQGHKFGPTTTIYLEDTLHEQYDHMITEVPLVDSIPGELLEVDALVSMRVFRDTASQDDLGDLVDAPFIFYADLHYQLDRISTPNKEPNFYN